MGPANGTPPAVLPIWQQLLARPALASKAIHTVSPEYSPSSRTHGCWQRPQNPTSGNDVQCGLARCTVARQARSLPPTGRRGSYGRRSMAGLLITIAWPLYTGLCKKAITTTGLVPAADGPTQGDRRSGWRSRPPLRLGPRKSTITDAAHWPGIQTVFMHCRSQVVGPSRGSVSVWYGRSLPILSLPPWPPSRPPIWWLDNGIYPWYNKDESPT
jgi:hypothetical protein